jgi:hypothetical protein
MKLAPLLLMAYAAASAAADVDVRIVRLGVDSVKSDADVVQRAVSLVESCSVDSTKYDASLQAWKDALAAASLVHLRFPATRDIKVLGNHYTVDEILVPLPERLWPAHFYARRGNEIFSFTFYDPRAFRDLVWGSPFEFQNVPPYDSLANLPNY